MQNGFIVVVFERAETWGLPGQLGAAATWPSQNTAISIHASACIQPDSNIQPPSISTLQKQAQAFLHFSFYILNFAFQPPPIFFSTAQHPNPSNAAQVKISMRNAHLIV
jgi:hypothetical protein